MLNPLDLGVVDLLSLHVNGGVDVTQHFDLTSLGLQASLKLEDGYTLPVQFGTKLPTEALQTLQQRANRIHLR